MALNNQGWTLIMNGLMDPMSLFIGANPVAGRATIDIGELKIDLRTLGGQNSWMNWGGINDRGEAVGEADTSVTTAKTIANSAHTVRVARFFGKIATSALSPRWAETTGRPAISISTDKKQEVRQRLSLIPDAHLHRLSWRCYGKKAKSSLFLRWVAIQTGSHSRSTIKAKP
jgi:hypothetical protein